MMNEQQNNQVDRIFREALQSAKDQPSADLWQKIESDLDKEEGQIFINKMRSRRRAAAILLMIMVGLGVIYSKMSNPRFTAEDKSGSAKQKSAGSQNKILKIAGTSLAIRKSLSDKPNQQNNNSLTRFETPLFKILPASQANSSSLNHTENFLNFSTVQKPESNIDIIQTKRIEFIPQRVNSEKMLVKPERKSTLNKLSITAFFSQEFAGYNLSDNDASAADGREIEKRERNAFTASLGFYLNYQINRKWVIQSGLSYSWSTSNIDSAKSYAVKDNSGNVQFKMNTISGYGYLQYPPAIPPTVGDSVLTDKAYSRIHYLTLPVVVSYRIPLKRFTLLMGLGVSLNLLTSATLETKIYGPNIMEQETVVPIKGLRSLNYGIILKADLEYHISNRLGVNVIPSFKNSLNPINIHSALSAYPYNFGIGAGLSYHF
jgi:hypothetical protein